MWRWGLWLTSSSLRASSHCSVFITWLRKHPGLFFLNLFSKPRLYSFVLFKPAASPQSTTCGNLQLSLLFTVHSHQSWMAVIFWALLWKRWLLTGLLMQLIENSCCCVRYTARLAWCYKNVLNHSWLRITVHLS